MNANPKTIADVRDHLFTLMDQLADMSREPNYERVRASCDVAQVIVNTVRVQVDYLRAVNGDGEMPFLDEPRAPTAIEPGRAAVDPLTSGPAGEHPWRRSVHRLGR